MSIPPNTTGIDHHVAQAIDAWADILFLPLEVAQKAMNLFEHLEAPPKKSLNETYLIKETALKIKDAWINYHRDGLSNGRYRAGIFETNIYDLSKRTLSFLTFCKIGKAIQENLSKRIGQVGFCIAFIAIEFFYQILPYLLFAGAVSGTVILFQSSPVTVIALCTGGILIVNILILYGLLKAGQKAARLEDKIEVIKKEGVDLIQNALKKEEKRLTEKAEQKAEIMAQRIKQEATQIAIELGNRLWHTIRHPRTPWQPPKAPQALAVESK